MGRRCCRSRKRLDDVAILLWQYRHSATAEGVPGNVRLRYNEQWTLTSLSLGPIVARREHLCRARRWCGMEIEYAFFAKFIDMAPDGLFSVHGGGVTALAAERFPMQVPTLYLLVRVRATPEEAGSEHMARFTLT